MRTRGNAEVLAERARLKEYLLEYMPAHGGLPPGYGELERLLGTSSSSVWNHLNKLVREGFIMRTGGHSSIRLVESAAAASALRARYSEKLEATDEAISGTDPLPASPDGGGVTADAPVVADEEGLSGVDVLPHPASPFGEGLMTQPPPLGEGDRDGEGQLAALRSELAMVEAENRRLEDEAEQLEEEIDVWRGLERARAEQVHLFQRLATLRTRRDKLARAVATTSLVHPDGEDPTPQNPIIEATARLVKVAVRTGLLKIVPVDEEEPRPTLRRPAVNLLNPGGNKCGAFGCENPALPNATACLRHIAPKELERLIAMYGARPGGAA